MFSVTVIRFKSLKGRSLLGFFGDVRFFHELFFRRSSANWFFQCFQLEKSVFRKEKVPFGHFRHFIVEEEILLGSVWGLFSTVQIPSSFHGVQRREKRFCNVIIIVSATAGIIFTYQQFDFFQFNFRRDFEYLLKILDNLFGSEW